MSRPKKRLTPVSIELPEWEVRLRALRDTVKDVTHQERPDVAAQVARAGLAEAADNPDESDVIKTRAAGAVALMLFGKI
jgi:hypothetical protein